MYLSLADTYMASEVVFEVADMEFEVEVEYSSNTNYSNVEVVEHECLITKEFQLKY